MVSHSVTGATPEGCANSDWLADHLFQIESSSQPFEIVVRVGFDLCFRRYLLIVFFLVSISTTRREECFLYRYARLSTHSGGVSTRMRSSEILCSQSLFLHFCIDVWLDSFIGIIQKNTLSSSLFLVPYLYVSATRAQSNCKAAKQTRCSKAMF